MKYKIEAQSKQRVRIRVRNAKLTKDEAEILKYAFSGIKGVTKVTVYRATGCCSLEFDCKKMEILDQLNRFRLGNVKVLADGEENKRISVAEMKNRKLDQQLKNKLRLRIIMEAAADMVLPMPVQLAYHAWQVVTLRNL